MSQWINVLDELPDRETDIVFVELIHSQYIHHGCLDNDNKWVSYAGWGIKPNRVTHWAYLPELPTLDDCWATREEITKQLVKSKERE